ncbi:MAG: cation transporter [Pseudorhodobacter sp.]|nr:cation transporter [Pseudorhodobacter sp.]
MKRFAILALGTLMLGLPATAPVAFTQSAAVAASTLAQVSFDVPGMTCALCPVTVKTAMTAVEGVQSVAVDFEARSATVIFDPALTDAAAIAEASAQAGYPANVKG